MTARRWRRRAAAITRLGFTYSVVGTQRVEGVGSTQKQASVSAEQHFDEVTAFILHERKTEIQRIGLICRRGESEEQMMAQIEKNPLFFRR